jgi:hypothetical protein|tara:strand:- start:47 stop:364 length:318 start_codon:yes stop_codon:yes gene_type:complete
MANGDITKEIEYDKIEVVNTWNIQVRQATKIMEEQADGSKKELTRSFHRYVLVPFNSFRDEDGKWKHTATDISGEDTSVQAIANAIWTDTVKTNYKTFVENRTTP